MKLSDILTGPCRSLETLPTQRRMAIQFRYGDLPQMQLEDCGGMFGPMEDQVIRSSTFKDFCNQPCDSWEIGLCVAFAVGNPLPPHAACSTGATS